MDRAIWIAELLAACWKQQSPEARKKSSSPCRASPTTMVGALEVESFTYGFALLTAAPGDRWSGG